VKFTKWMFWGGWGRQSSGCSIHRTAVAPGRWNGLGGRVCVASFANHEESDGIKAEGQEGSSRKDGLVGLMGMSRTGG
jgi:hypothetical protein